MPVDIASTHVLDASALIAFLLREPGAEVVTQACPAGLISTVNVSEVIAKLLDRGSTYDKILYGIAELSFRIADFEIEAAHRAGALREFTRRRNVSFADRACLELAMTTWLPLYTTDRVWAELDLGLDIRLIR